MAVLVFLILPSAISLSSHTSCHGVGQANPSRRHDRRLLVRRISRSALLPPFPAIQPSFTSSAISITISLDICISRILHSL